MTGIEYVAECLLPDVRESDLRTLDERVADTRNGSPRQAVRSATSARC